MRLAICKRGDGGCLFVGCAAAATVSSNPCKCEFDKMFVFGDSYVDTGNRDPRNSTYTATGRVNQNWEPPYGRTYPGVPAGHFSDGKVLSDYLGTTLLINIIFDGMALIFLFF